MYILIFLEQLFSHFRRRSKKKIIWIIDFDVDWWKMLQWTLYTPLPLGFSHSVVFQLQAQHNKAVSAHKIPSVSPPGVRWVQRHFVQQDTKVPYQVVVAISWGKTSSLLTSPKSPSHWPVAVPWLFRSCQVLSPHRQMCLKEWQVLLVAKSWQ